MASHYAYRVEISGGFSGSAVRYHSLLCSTLQAVEALLKDEARDGMNGSMLVTENFSIKLEYLEDQVCRAVVDLRPSLTLRGARHTYTFQEMPALDGVLLDWDTLQQHLDTIIDDLIDGAEAVLDLSIPGLPTPQGRPLPEGTVWSITNTYGHIHEQACGSMIGDFCEAWAFLEAGPAS